MRQLNLEKLSYLKAIHADYIDGIFQLYTQDPESVDSSWKYFFDGLEVGSSSLDRLSGDESNQPTAGVIPASRETVQKGVDPKEAKVAALIMAYREMGWLVAHTNPLMPQPLIKDSGLDFSQLGLESSDLQRSFAAGHLLGMGSVLLSAILTRLQQTYCRSIGVEFTHIRNREERDWLQQKMESCSNQESLEEDSKKSILKRLIQSESLERFLHTRYVAQKRFSIEGAEAMIPALDKMIERGAEYGAEEFVLGMAHRGRLNVLVNLMGKKPETIFSEFEGISQHDLSLGEGDVKYHMGYSADVVTSKGKGVHLSLASNPSHLEFINPVVVGLTRAKQALRQDHDQHKVIPIAIHGDAAFAGQGVCYETINFSQLPGYRVGGTLHIVINNQIGFTTSPEDARSTHYCTDLAKMLEVPIFHVNGDDVEALCYVAQLCVEYRQKFKKDIFIDLICYRRYGHNEGDEPAFTQPLLYKKIKDHASTQEIYRDRLVAAQILSADQAKKWTEEVIDGFTDVQTKMRKEVIVPFVSVFEGAWKGIQRPKDSDFFASVNTSVSAASLKEAAKKLNHIPGGFHLHSKLNRFFEARLKAVEEGEGIDWGNGEALAFATLLLEGHPVRLSGQDVGRGTFSHRHSVLHDTETGQKYVPLNHLKSGQSVYEACNSHLSETGVLGFEYGYSLADPHTLVIWEAQFGDFANGAQVIIDQFVAASESKWQRMSGLTLLLPHGFEGQGPEHSSARLERFLQLSGRNNWVVCNLTQPAQLFHALRRQVKRHFRKPLVIMSPKSLLRHPLAISSLKDFSERNFQEVLDDLTVSNQGAIKRVLLCSGKVYYDLLAHKKASQREDVALIRIEQLYPWPEVLLSKILGRYPSSAELIWVQEEPQNMGAWSFVFSMWAGGLACFQEKVGGRSIRYIGRGIGAAPAVGSHKIHEIEQEGIIKKAFL